MRFASSRILLVTLAVAALALGTSCASDDHRSNDLDIVQTTKAGKGAESAAGPALKDDAITNWQGFFKAPPDKGARQKLEQQLSKWSDNGDEKTLLARGRAEVALGRIAAAQATFRQILRQNSRSKEAALELATLFLREKSIDNAFDLLTQVKDGIATDDATTSSFIFRYRYVLSQAYLARGDTVRGHKILSDLIGIDKMFAPAYAALARSYMAGGKDSVAEFVLRRGLDRVKNDPNLLTMMGVIAARERQSSVARSWFERALLANPRFVPALVNRAALSAAELEYGPAEEDLLTALTYDPTNASALVTLGIVQRRQGNINGARASFTRAIDLAPDDATARFNLGVLLADDAKKPTEAMRLFSEVLQTANADRDIKEVARSYLNDLKGVGEPY